MKLKTIKFLVILISSIFLITNITFAKELEISILDILQKLEETGYKQVLSIKHQKRIYEIEVNNSQGYKVKFEVKDTESNIPLLNNVIRQNLSTLKIAEIVLEAGYKNIYEIKYNKDCYKVKAYDKNNKKIELNLDAFSGLIRHQKEAL